MQHAVDLMPVLGLADHLLAGAEAQQFQISLWEMLTGQAVHAQSGFERRSGDPALRTDETLPQVEQARGLVALFEEALETTAQCGGLAQVRSAFGEPNEEYGGA